VIVIGDRKSGRSRKVSRKSDRSHFDKLLQLSRQL